MSINSMVVKSSISPVTGFFFRCTNSSNRVKRVELFGTPFGLPFSFPLSPFLNWVSLFGNAMLPVIHLFELSEEVELNPSFYLEDRCATITLPSLVSLDMVSTMIYTKISLICLMGKCICVSYLIFVFQVL